MGVAFLIILVLAFVLTATFGVAFYRLNHPHGPRSISRRRPWVQLILKR